jgi:hypothetical protein
MQSNAADGARALGCRQRESVAGYGRQLAGRDRYEEGQNVTPVAVPNDAAEADHTRSIQAPARHSRSDPIQRVSPGLRQPIVHMHVAVSFMYFRLFYNQFGDVSHLAGLAV